MKRALKGLGVLVAVVLLLVGLVWGREQWRARERRELLREEAVRAPVANPQLRPVEPARLPAPRPECVTGVVLQDKQPVAGVLVSAAALPLQPPEGCPCGAPASCHCPAGLAWMLDTLPEGAGLVDGEESATTDAQGHFSLCGPAHPRLFWAETGDGRFGVADDSERGTRSQGPVVLTLLPPRTLSGRIVEADTGRPIPDAELLLTLTPAVRSRRARSGPDGRFTMKGATPAFWSLTARAPGFAVTRFSSDEREVVVRLTRPTRLLVTVLHRGARVPEARVTLDSAQHAVTGPDGTAVVENAVKGSSGSLTARKGLLVGRSRVDIRPPEQRAFVELEPGCEAAGTLRRDDGGPVEGARVTLSGAMRESTLAGPGGQFTLPSLPRGQYSLRLFVPGCVAQEDASVFLQGDAVDLSREVPCAPTVGGTVVDAQGVPVANAELTARLGTRVATAQSDTLGRFEFLLPPGSHDVTVEATGYRSRHVPLTAPGLEHRVVLDAGGTVSGRVVDVDGAPVVGAEVVVLPTTFAEMMAHDSDNHPARTDEQGRFSVGGLQPGRLKAAVVTGAGSGQSDELLLRPGAVVEGVLVQLRGEAPITGTVTDEQGQPVPAAYVNAQVEEKDSALPRLLGGLARGDLTPVMAAMGTDARTDLDGRFTLRPAMDLGLKLEVTAGGFEPVSQSVRPGDRLSLTMKRQAVRRVRGRVVDARGPLTAFVLQGDAYASEDGRFQYDARPHETELTVSAPGHAHLTKALPPGEDLGDVTLPDGVEVSVVVRDDGAAPAPRVSVSLRQGSSRAGCVTDAQGRCTVKGLVEGPAKAEANGQALKPLAQDVTISAAQPEVALTLRRAQGGVTGLVTMRGQPQEGETLELRPNWDHQRTDAAGRFTFSSLPPDTYRVSLRRGGTGWAAKAVVQDAVVELPFELGDAALEGEARVGGDAVTAGLVVALSGGAPTLGGDALFDPGSEVLEHASRASWAPVVDGRYVLEGLPPGEWALYVVRVLDLTEKALAPVKTVSVGAGGRQRVDLSR